MMTQARRPLPSPSQALRTLAEEIAHEAQLGEGATHEAALADLIEDAFTVAIQAERAAWLKDGPERERTLALAFGAQMAENERLEEENAKLEALPELSGLLGELAALQVVLESILSGAEKDKPTNIGDLTSYGRRLERWEMAQAANSTLDSDSGRLAAELIRAATNLRLREQVNQLRITFPMAPDGSGPETPDDLKDFEALGDLLDAGNGLFQAFPALREEVER